MEKSVKIFKSSAIVLLIIVLAKLVALGEDATIASLIGTSGSADAYYMSADILQLFWYFGTLGIVRVYLPEYKSQLILYGKASAESYSRNMQSFFSIFALLITGIIFLLAGPLVSIMAYGFTDESKMICSEYVRLRTPQIIFWCWTSLTTAKLQSQNKFIASKIPEIAVHIPVILLAVVLYSRFGIYAIFSGLIIGSILGFVIQIPFLDGRFCFSLRFKLKEKGVVDSLKRLPAAFISAALTQIHSIVDKIMASAQPVGAVSSLSYGHKMYTAVNGLISGAISTVAYPKITEYAAIDDKNKLGEFIRSILLVLLFIMIPFSIAFILFASDLTRILFMRGAFGEESVWQVAQVFSAYTLGLSFAGISSIVQLVFFAYGNTKIPMYTSTISIVCNIVLNYLFVQFWGVRGIAFASSIASVIACVSLLVCSRKSIGIINKHFIKRIVRIFICSLACCLLAYSLTNALFPAGHAIIRLLFAALVGTGSYCLVIFLVDKDIIKTIKHL